MQSIRIVSKHSQFHHSPYYKNAALEILQAQLLKSANPLKQQLNTQTEKKLLNMAQQLSLLLLLLGLICMAHGQGLSEEDKEDILNAHNHYRGQVDPISTNMLKMVRNL